MNYCKTAGEYADAVIDGEIPACKTVKQACQPLCDDIDKSQNDSDYPYFLDLKAADDWCRFLEKLPHTKGHWVAKQEFFKLSPWQIFCTVNIFGWRSKKTKLRRFREAYIEVPRKNGKSLYVAGIGLGMLTIDKEFGAEVNWNIWGQSNINCLS